MNLLALAAAATLSVGFASCGDDDDEVVTPEIIVSPSTVSILAAKNSSSTVTVKAKGEWTLSGCPDWLHTSATSGSGNTSVTLTALSENWSDEARAATLTFRENTSSTFCNITVSQLGSLPQGLRVQTSNMTIMRDGFACDLSFGPKAKGHREAFFTEQAVQTKTDRDIFDKLMEQQEWNTLENYTFLPDWVEPNTTIVYCVAAYGNETNDDGTHKYGPITIQRIRTKSSTIYDDMYLTKSYNSSRWTVMASRQGNYGQRCDEYYYLAAEGDDADAFYLRSMTVTDALLAHLFFKPNITQNRNWNYCNGPQTMNWTRTSDRFFCTTWGVDRDTKEFSAELSSPVYYDLSSSSVKEYARVKSDPSEWNKRHWRLSKEEIERMRNAVRVYKVNK